MLPIKSGQIGNVGKTALALLITVCASPEARAQTGLYFEGSGTMSVQGSQDLMGTDSHDSGPGVGGTAIGFTVALGFPVNRSVTMATELSLPTRFEAVKGFHHGIIESLDYQYRDVVISELLHIRAPARRVSLEFVGGFSVVNQDASLRIADGGAEFNPKPFGPFGAPISQGAWTWGITVGLDVAIRVSEHVAFIPQIRGHLIQRADTLSDLGLATLVLRPAVGGRWTF
jgi:hypothetical protein